MAYVVAFQQAWRMNRRRAIVVAPRTNRSLTEMGDLDAFIVTGEFSKRGDPICHPKPHC